MGDTTELLLVKRVRDLLECMGSLAVLVLGGGGPHKTGLWHRSPGRS